jgi:hypothetical protein
MNDGEGAETFLARRAKLKATGINGNGMGTPLAVAATMWPTPSAISDPKGAPAGTHIIRKDGSTQSRETGGVLAYAAEQLWRTPTSQSENALRGRGMTAETAQRRVENGNTLNLQDQVAMWATPRAEMARALGNPKHITDRRGNGNIEDQAAQWSTPSIAGVEGGRMARSGARSNEPLMKGQAESLSSRLGRPTSPHGNPSPSALLTFYRRMRATTDSELRSEMRALLRMAIRQRGRGWTRKVPTAFVRPSFKRSLNPCFVAWLMGWPPIASTGFGFSETAWSIWRQDMRSALSQLASPSAAPPMQLALFGR